MFSLILEYARLPECGHRIIGWTAELCQSFTVCRVACIFSYILKHPDVVAVAVIAAAAVAIVVEAATFSALAFGILIEPLLFP